MLILAEILEALLRYQTVIGHLGVSPYTRRRRITSLHSPIKVQELKPETRLLHGSTLSVTVTVPKLPYRNARGNDSDGATWASFTFSQQGTAHWHSRQVTPKRNHVSEVFLYACLRNCSVTRAARICLGALVHSKDRRFRPMRMGGGTSSEIGVVASVTLCASVYYVKLIARSSRPQHNSFVFQRNSDVTGRRRSLAVWGKKASRAKLTSGKSAALIKERFASCKPSFCSTVLGFISPRLNANQGRAICRDIPNHRGCSHASFMMVTMFCAPAKKSLSCDCARLVPHDGGAGMEIPSSSLG